MAKRKRRKFTAEYKAEVVGLVHASGKGIGQVAKELDLTETAAVGDPSSLAQCRDERRGCDPDRDAGAARGVSHRVGVEERLIDDEIGAGGYEPEGEARAGVVAGCDAA